MTTFSTAKVKEYYINMQLQLYGCTNFLKVQLHFLLLTFNSEEYRITPEIQQPCTLMFYFSFFEEDCVFPPPTLYTTTTWKLCISIRIFSRALQDV